jgi:regulatory protein
VTEARDEVGAARDWLRRHGVDVPASAASDSPAAGPDVRGSDRTSPGAGGGRRVGDGRGTQDGRDAHDAHDGRGPDVGEADARERAAGRAGRRPPDGGRRRGRSRAGATGRGDRLGRTDLRDVEDVEVGEHGGQPRVRGAAGDDGPDADPEQVARSIVLRKLTAQSRTRAELERALRSKAVPEEAASAVLDRMGEVGLVDDAAFARDWVASRQQRRHLSRTALRRELQTKGVDRDVIDEALAEVGGADEHRAALDLAQRKAATMGGLAREVAYRRLGGVLARRGFSASVTSRVLSEILDAPDED